MNKFFYYVVCLIALSILCACGGGTVGTGGGREYSGMVLDKSSLPVANATVSLTDSGESTLTDANGSFTITAKEPAEKESFTITVEDVETTTTIENIPQADSIEVLFVVDTTDSSVEGTIVDPDSDIDPEETNSGSESPVDTDDGEADSDSDNSPDNQTLNAHVTFDTTSDVVVAPTAGTTFQELSTLSTFSMFFAIFDRSTDHSATATLYFFRVGENTWEYQLYIDESEVNPGVPRRPLQLAKGILEFDQSSLLVGGAKNQMFEVVLVAQELPTVCNLIVNASLAQTSNEGKIQATTSLDLSSTFSISDPLTTMPASRSFSSLSSAASFEKSVQVVDLAGDSHTLRLFILRTTQDRWELLVLADGADIRDASAGNVVEFANFDLNFAQGQNTEPKVSSSQDVFIHWAGRPETQVINVNVNATVGEGPTVMSINAQ